MLQVMPADAGLKFRMKYGPRWNYIRLTLLKATLTDLSLAQKEICISSQNCPRSRHIGTLVSRLSSKRTARLFFPKNLDFCQTSYFDSFDVKT